MLSRTSAAAPVMALVALAAGCGRQSVASDGYRARLVVGVGQSMDIAARGDRTRITRMGGTNEIWTTIRRPDLGKQWDYRPFGAHANKVIESKLRPRKREGYWDDIPPTAGFDAQKYAEQFQGSARFRDHLSFAEHPCDVWDVTFFKGGVDRIWLATDLASLPVRIQHGVLLPADLPGQPDELRASTDLQLARIQVGAPPSLFELPEGATIIPNPDD